MVISFFNLNVLTVRNEGSNEAGGSSHEVGGGEGKAPADAFDGEEDKERSGELHQARDEEVNVDISPQNPEPHDQTLVDNSTGEPAGGKERNVKGAGGLISFVKSSGRTENSPVVAEDESVFSYFRSSDQVHEGGGVGVSVIICQRLQSQMEVRINY